jgi:hypothetical protein
VLLLHEAQLTLRAMPPRWTQLVSGGVVATVQLRGGGLPGRDQRRRKPQAAQIQMSPSSLAKSQIIS